MAQIYEYTGACLPVWTTDETENNLSDSPHAIHKIINTNHIIQPEIIKVVKTKQSKKQVVGGTDNSFNKRHRPLLLISCTAKIQLLK